MLVHFVTLTRLVRFGIQVCRNSCEKDSKVTQNKMVRFVLKLGPKSRVGSEEFKYLVWWPVSSGQRRSGNVHQENMSVKCVPP